MHCYYFNSECLQCEELHPIHKMTMTSFAVTFCAHSCQRHVVGQRDVSDITIVTSCWSICSLCSEFNDTTPAACCTWNVFLLHIPNITWPTTWRRHCTLLISVCMLMFSCRWSLMREHVFFKLLWLGLGSTLLKVGGNWPKPWPCPQIFWLQAYSSYAASSYRCKKECSVAFKILQNAFPAGKPRTQLADLMTLPQTP